MNKKPFKFGYGDEAFYVGTGKIKKGFIKSVSYRHDKFANELYYYIANDLGGAWEGDKRQEHEVFSTKAELIKYLESLDV